MSEGSMRQLRPRATSLDGRSACPTTGDFPFDRTSGLMALVFAAKKSAESIAQVQLNPLGVPNGDEAQ